jgi:lactate dehydrogenase-like 2-hydroxyacid dehydrogenase
MTLCGSGNLGCQCKPSVAIYDMPRIVGERLRKAIESAGHAVLFEGPLSTTDPAGARSDADIWITKWSFGLTKDFLSQAHPRLGFISATSGVDHIDKEAMAALGLRAENCPTFSTRSVAEHALALSYRGLFTKPALPPLSEGQVVFSGFSNHFAVQAIAEILMRNRQIDQSIERAKAYCYQDGEGRRPDAPWYNRELSGSRIGIIGKAQSSLYFANVLKSGFDCEIMGHDLMPSMAAYASAEYTIPRILQDCEYVFVCDDKYFAQERMPNAFPAHKLDIPRQLLNWPTIAVLGTGAIGSYIAKICAQGFRCQVNAFNRSAKHELRAMGVQYPGLGLDPDEAIARTVNGAHFIYVALPFNNETKGFDIAGCIQRDGNAAWRVLVNVTRDRILQHDALRGMLDGEQLLSYATDVVPGDFLLCSGEQPGAEVRSFVEHSRVVPTPHEAECSKNSLDRLVAEVSAKLDTFMR